MPDAPDDRCGLADAALRASPCLPGWLLVVSWIGGRRMTHTDGVVPREIWVEAMCPVLHPAAHLQFHLRHEVPHLDFLVRLFTATGPDIVQTWVAEEPASRYARREVFLYEWLTGRMLHVPPRSGGNYVDAIDAARLIAASPGQVVKVLRWRVNGNLPGTWHFCPILVQNTCRGAGGGAECLLRTVQRAGGRIRRRSVDARRCPAVPQGKPVEFCDRGRGRCRMPPGFTCVVWGYALRSSYRNFVLR